MTDSKRNPAVRGVYGRFRVVKGETGYRAEVKLQHAIAGQEWGTLETYDYLANARQTCRELRRAMNWPLSFAN